jgi:acetyltransferase-like isoleucine patch superfamily enzyme
LTDPADFSFYEAGEGSQIQPGCVVGLKYRPACAPARIGKNASIRVGSIIYADVSAGDFFQTGHHAMIRENTRIGNHVVIGTNTVIDGNVTIADFVKVESNCYICTHVTIGSRVFFGPNVTLLNDKYPLKMRDDYRPQGPVIEDDVTLGGGVVVLPGVRVGAGSFVAAGAVVTKDVPPNSFVKGVPGEVSALPAKLQERNLALSWRKHIK